MQKIIFLLLFVMSSSMHAMENSSFSRFFSFVCSFVCSDQVANESEVMQGLRANKNKFEEQLQIKEWVTEYMSPPTWELFSSEEVDNNPVQFLKFCYWQKHHKKPMRIRIEQYFDYPSSLFHKCRNVRINGYSALGAAIIAKGVFNQDKGNFILDLKDRGYTLTEKDKELLVLELYDSIPVENKKAMMLLLCNHQANDLSFFPYDVRKYIVQYMIGCFKKGHTSVMDLGKHDPKFDDNYLEIVINPLFQKYEEGAQ